jgi:uncharacterized protein (TIGR00369 family)
MNASRRKEILAKARLAPCIESLRLHLLDCEDGFCKLHAPQDPSFNGILPGFHGGMLANVADCAAWFAIVTLTGPDEPLVTTDMHMRYLGPCLGDATVEARLIKLGRTLCPVEVRIFDPVRKQVACGTVTYIRLNALGGRT